MDEDRLGRYRLLRRIGVGGMAEVFRAELVGAEGVARELVVKRIQHALALDPAAVALFVNEARIAARLRHPNVVQVYEFGRWGGAYFLAMELVEGCDLASLVKAAAASEARLPLGVVAHVIGEVLEGLAYVHALEDPDGGPLGLVHRDVSPHNVLLSTAGEVKLADFGIAKAASAAGHVTGPAHIRGKFAYMAPEQARGEPLDARTDLFAVGVMLYEMLAGRRPQSQREDGDILDAVREGRLIPLSVAAPEVPEALVALVSRAIAPVADARFPDARAFRAELLTAVESLGARPDREALRARVSALSRASSVTSRPERTLTAEDPPAPEAPAPSEPPPEPARAAEGEGPVAIEAAKPLRGLARWRRRVFDRAVVVLGLGVVAALAGVRLAREAPRAPVRTRAEANPSARRRVRVAWPAEWGGGLDAALRRGLEARCGCVVGAVTYSDERGLASLLREGEADVAQVPGSMVGALVAGDALRRLDTLFSEVDAEGWVTLRGALRGEALRLGWRRGPAGEGTYFLPAVVDALVMAYRPSAASAAVEGFPSARGALEARLVALTGRGLPVGFTLRASPEAWTTWDLLAASWTWAHGEGATGGRLWVPSGPGLAFSRAWRARVEAVSSEEGGSNGRADAVTALGWDVLSGALGLHHPAVLGSPGRGPDLRDRSVAAALVLVSELQGAGPWEDLALARLPRGDSFALDDVGDPVRAGSRRVAGEAWGYVIGRGSSHAGLAARVAAASLEAGAVGTLRARHPGLSARREPLAQAATEGQRFVANALVAGRYSLLELQAGDGLGAGWRSWSLAVRGVVGVGEGRWRPELLAPLAAEGLEPRANRDSLGP